MCSPTIIRNFKFGKEINTPQKCLEKFEDYQIIFYCMCGNGAEAHPLYYTHILCTVTALLLLT